MRKLKGLQDHSGTINQQIKQIRLWDKNIQLLREQLPSSSTAERPAILAKIAVAEDEIDKLEAIAQRRKQVLLEQLATIGIDADPKISLEIEDINNYFTENLFLQGELD